jgi:hypothetical protein
LPNSVIRLHRLQLLVGRWGLEKRGKRKGKSLKINA